MEEQNCCDSGSRLGPVVLVPRDRVVVVEPGEHVDVAVAVDVDREEEPGVHLRRDDALGEGDARAGLRRLVAREAAGSPRVGCPQEHEDPHLGVAPRRRLYAERRFGASVERVAPAAAEQQICCMPIAFRFPQSSISAPSCA